MSHQSAPNPAPPPEDDLFGTLFRTDSQDAEDQAPPPIEPTPGTLEHAISAMDPNMSNDQISSRVKRFYQTAKRDPAQFASVVVSYNEGCKSRVGPHPRPPIIFLAAFGNQIWMCHSLAKVPDKGPAAASAWKGKTVVCLGEHTPAPEGLDKNFCSLSVVDPESLFARRFGPVAQFETSLPEEPAAATVELLPPGAEVDAFFPFLVLEGKATCELVYRGFQVDGAEHPWTPQRLGWALKDYINSFPAGTLRKTMGMSLMALVTHGETSPDEPMAAQTRTSGATSKGFRVWMSRHISNLMTPMPVPPNNAATVAAPQASATPTTATAAASPQASATTTTATVAAPQASATTTTATVAAPQASATTTTATAAAPPQASATTTTATVAAPQASAAPTTANAAASPQASATTPTATAAASPQASATTPTATAAAPPQASATTTTGAAPLAPTTRSRKRDPLNDSSSDSEDGHRSSRSRRHRLTGAIQAALMGYSQSRTPEEIPPNWITWFREDKHQQRTWFKSQVSAMRQMEPTAFHLEFDYPTSFATDMLALTLTTSPAEDQWWKGIVGAHLQRSRADMQTQNQLRENEDRFGARLVVDDRAALERRGKAPPRMLEWEDLDLFLLRLHTFLSEWLPRSHLWELTNRFRSILTTSGRTFRLRQDPDWRHHRIANIVWFLKELEMQEFNHTMGEQDFRPEEEPNFFEPQWALLPTAQRVFDDYNAHTMPPSLRPPAQRAQLPALQLPPRAQGNRGPPPGPAPRNAGPPPPRNSGSFQPHQNTNYAAPLKAFWDSPQGSAPNVRNANLGRLLNRGNSSTLAILELMGLHRHACGHFHLRGKCSFSNCTRHHEVAPPVPANVAAQVVAILERGAQSM